MIKTTYKDIVKDCRLDYVEVYVNGKLRAEIRFVDGLWQCQTLDKVIKMVWNHEPILDNVKAEFKNFMEHDTYYDNF